MKGFQIGPSRWLRSCGARGLRGVAVLALGGSALVGVAISGAPLAAAATSSPVCSSGTCTVMFSYTGSAQSWSVPAGVSAATFDVLGAAGGEGATTNGSMGAFFGVEPGGLGGETLSTLADLFSGEAVDLVVGGQGAAACTGATNAGGFNGGGDGTNVVCPASLAAPAVVGGGGGGASDVRIGGNTLDDRVLVAGGGGGGGGSEGGLGGAGGGSTGGTAGGSGNSCGGTGGGQDASGGSGVLGNGSPGESSDGGGNGGGGGGYYGGAGGGNGSNIYCGGGGGSGFGPTGAVLTSGVQAGNGEITVSYPDPLVAGAPSYPTTEGTPLLVSSSEGVLSPSAGTTVPPGAGAIASVVTGPSHGTLNLENDGAFTYTPGSGYTGSDSFTYEVTDASGDQASATVQVDVNAPVPVVASVSGAQTYGSSGPVFNYTDNAPSGVDVTGAVTCSNLEQGEPISATLTASSYTVAGSSCSGLTLTGTAASGFSLSYTGVADGFVVSPAPLTVTASSTSFTSGGMVPAVIPTYSGFVNGESASSLTEVPVCSTAATSSSPPGSYPATCSGAVDANYDISYVAGTITVVAASSSGTPAATAATTRQPRQPRRCHPQNPSPTPISRCQTAP